MAKGKGLNKVHILQRPAAGGKASLYLYWSVDNKKSKEATGLQIFVKPSSVLERHHNKEALAKAEAIRTLRESQIYKGEIEEIQEAKNIKYTEFVPYFERYVKEYKQKDLRVMKAVLGQFKEYAPSNITAKEITEEFCLKFKEHLNDTLSGETPQSYFARFKKVLQYATKYGKLFRFNPAYDVKNTSTKDSIVKDVLTIEEIKTLTETYCGNEAVKRAFLFSCFTGIRWVDVKNLIWSNINTGVLTFSQSKTKEKAKDGGKVEIPLSNTALNQLPEKGKANELIFVLPSHNAALKNLRNWTAKAGIEKHITFHSARHTFGTLLASNANDINIIANLLGHTSLKHTTKYIRIAEDLKRKAVNSIPEIY